MRSRNHLELAAINFHNRQAVNLLHADPDYDSLLDDSDNDGIPPLFPPQNIEVGINESPQDHGGWDNPDLLQNDLQDINTADKSDCQSHIDEHSTTETDEECESDDQRELCY